MAIASASPHPVGAQRVTLRPAHPGDAAVLQRFRRQPSVGRHQPLRDLRLDELREELSALRPSDLWANQGERFQWLVLADREPVGWITVRVLSWEHGLAELGYALGEEHRGRGLMGLALARLVADLFSGTALFRLEARVALGNLASQRLLERQGFVREGLLRGYFMLDGERVDNYLYALLETDWLRREKARGARREEPR